MTTRLLIARHGNTFGPHDIVRRVGKTDLPLVESGVLQGRLLGTYLRQHHLVPDVIFTSQLKRAIQTAEAAQSTMHTNLSIETLSIFNEIDYGPDENQPEDSVIARLGKDALQAWEAEAKAPLDWNIDPSEIIKNWLDFSAKLRQDYADKTCLVVTSNGVARFAPHITGNFTAFREQHNIKLSTGAFSLFEQSQSCNEWKCIQWNIKTAVIK